VGTSGGRTFAEPITLSSTDRVDFPLPGTALAIDFNLLASRTRRRQDNTVGLGKFQGLSTAENRKVVAICECFNSPHFHSYPSNLWKSEGARLRRRQGSRAAEASLAMPVGGDAGFCRRRRLFAGAAGSISEGRIALVHLRMPSFDPGLTAFLWAFGLGVFLWLGMLAVGVSSATSFIFAALSAGAIFLFVRLYGVDERRQPSRRRAGAR
jgi:hypothetical protein